MAYKTKQRYTQYYETPSAINQSELESLVFHFNWNICSNITQGTLKERIDALDGHIQECS